MYYIIVSQGVNVSRNLLDKVKSGKFGILGRVEKYQSSYGGYKHLSVRHAVQVAHPVA